MKKNKKGFTLIELLAVIVILGIVMALTASSVDKLIVKARTGSYVDAYKVLVKDMQTQLMANEMNSTNGTASLATCNDDNEEDSEKCVNKVDYKGSYKIETLKMQVANWEESNTAKGYTVTINPGSNFSAVDRITCPVTGACNNAEIQIHLAFDGTVTSGREDN